MDKLISNKYLVTTRMGIVKDKKQILIAITFNLIQEAKTS